MQIGRSDVIWNYTSSFLKIAASVLLLPLILHKMPAETVGIWTIFTTVTSLILLLDFGFTPSFTRNVTYVFSGVQKLKKTGYDTISKENSDVDYGLLKGVISSMHWFYSRVSILLFLLLISGGTYYIHVLLQHYTGSTSDVYKAWLLLCAINTYNLFTLYYDSLLQGKGLIKRSKQIVIVGQMIYLLIASVLVLLGYGLVALVTAQASSVLVIRFLSYRSFFTRELNQALRTAVPRERKEILTAIYPNAVKVGLTMVGGFAVSRSATVIGSLFLSLEQIASYGITIQLIGVISGLGGIYTSTFLPKISQYRIQNNLPAIKDIYIKGQVLLVATFIAGGLGLLCFGELALSIIKSKTMIMPREMISLALLITFLEVNHGIAGGTILLSKNEVPFFRAALYSGAATVVLLLLFMNYTTLNLWGLLLSPGIAQGCYQNWKWPLVVQKELAIKFSDYWMSMKKMAKFRYK